jgi:hypothetical protein
MAKPPLEDLTVNDVPCDVAERMKKVAVAEAADEGWEVTVEGPTEAPPGSGKCTLIITYKRS